jgi:hypothetical protein
MAIPAALRHRFQAPVDGIPFWKFLQFDGHRIKTNGGATAGVPTLDAQQSPDCGAAGSRSVYGTHAENEIMQIAPVLGG